jgi:hypothetical protein
MMMNLLQSRLAVIYYWFSIADVKAKKNLKSVNQDKNCRLLIAQMSTGKLNRISLYLAWFPLRHLPLPSYGHHLLILVIEAFKPVS